MMMRKRGGSSIASAAQFLFKKSIFLSSNLSTITKGPKTKATPPPAEGFMQGLESSKILCHSREQTLANPELMAAGIDKECKLCCWGSSFYGYITLVIFYGSSH
jgi:hypothetical protein